MSRKGTSSTRVHWIWSSEISCPGWTRPKRAHSINFSRVSGPKVSSCVRRYHVASLTAVSPFQS